MLRTSVLLLFGGSVVACSGCTRTEPAAVPVQISPARPVNPAQYKLAYKYTDVKELSSLSGEYFFREDRVYHFLDASDEVMIIEPAQKMVRFLDLRRKVATELSFARIDAAIENYGNDLRAGIKANQQQNTRAGRIEAAMEADLLEPHWSVEGDDRLHRIRLFNETIEVDATGIPEPDEARLARVGEALSINIKLTTLRFPDAIAPFAHLDTLSVLARDRKLMPSEISFLFRLAGPPEKYLWSYGFGPTLTDREWEALRRVDALLIRTKTLTFDRYERLIDRVRIR